MSVRSSDAMTSLVHLLIPSIAEKAAALLPKTMALHVLQLEALQATLDQTGCSTTLNQWLTEDERQLFSSFSLWKRRLEWLGGRIAAKVSLLSLLGDHDPLITPNRLEILPDHTGRPLLTGPAGASPEKFSLSISHSGGYAAAMASRDRPCGLDIQYLSPALEGIKERFSSPAERMFLQSCPQLSHYSKLEQLAMLWSAKEAFRKALHLSPLPGFQEIRLTGEPRPVAGAFHLATAFIRNGKQWDYSVISWLENEMAVAITFL